MNPAGANSMKVIEDTAASSSLLATNARILLLSFFVVLAVFVHRQVLRLMNFLRPLNY